MSSTRDKKNKSENLFEDAVLIPNVIYPPRIKAKYKYLFPLKTYEDKKAENEGKKSSHTINTAVKSKDDIDLEKIKRDRKYTNVNRFFHVKKHNRKKKGALVEAVSAAFCQFLAPENVPDIYALYEEDEECSLILSNFIPKPENINDLPFTTNKAYARFGRWVYFIDRENKECTLLKEVSETEIKQFDDLLGTEKLKYLKHQTRLLKPQELIDIEKAIKHPCTKQTTNNNQGSAREPYVAVASKNITNFKTNHDDPLKETDVCIPIMDSLFAEETLECNQRLTNVIQALKLHFEAIDEERKKCSIASTFWQAAKESFNSTIRLQHTSGWFKKLLSNLEDKEKSKTAEEHVESLLKSLKERLFHIEGDENNSDHKKEFEILKQACIDAQNLKDLISTRAVTTKVIRKLETIYRHAAENNLIDLDDCDHDNEISDCAELKITKKELKNYRIVKRLAVGLVTRYLMEDTDCHNQNMSKDGWMIDFDMALLPIQFEFRDPDFWDYHLRKPKEHMFDITPDDIINFPNLKDADFFYWPTKQTVLSESTRNLISCFYKLKENFFGVKDNEVFQKLAKHPVFIFHKYKTFLKYILFDGEMLKNVGQLHLSADAMYPDQQRCILAEIIKHKEARIAKVREVLKQVPEFQKFLAYNGDYAMQLLKNEFLEYRKKYLRKFEKLAKKKDKSIQDLKTMEIYQKLLDSVDMNAIRNRYQEIFTENGADRLTKENIIEKNGAPVSSFLRCTPSNSN